MARYSAARTDGWRYGWGVNHQLPDIPGFSTRSMGMTHPDGVIVAHLVDAETASAGDHTVTDPDECIE